MNYVDLAFFDHKSWGPTFEALENVRKAFSCKVGSVDAIQYGDAVSGGKTIRVQNRVACPVKEMAPGTEDLGEPGKDVDPQGVFKKHIMKTRNLRYTSENEILFYRAQNVTGYVHSYGTGSCSYTQ